MAKAALILLLSCCAAGCALLAGEESRDAAGPRASADAAQPPAAAERARAGERLGVYLATLRDLVADDPVTRADAFRAAAAAVESAPTTTNRLNLALALATAGHASTDAAAAQQLLNELLAAGPALLPEERILATVHLKDVEQRLILDAEARRLRADLTAAGNARNAASARQLELALAENRRLKEALDEAIDKLDAITTIERAIRERDNAPTAQ